MASGGQDEQREIKKEELKRERSSSLKGKPAAKGAETHCKHQYYFFSSRAKQIREMGRKTIACEGCDAQVKVRSLLSALIPSVLVVVEGGTGTMDTVASTNQERAHPNAKKLQDDHHLPQKKTSSVPIVVVEGSGRAADFISFVWRHMHENNGLCEMASQEAKHNSELNRSKSTKNSGEQEELSNTDWHDSFKSIQDQLVDLKGLLSEGRKAVAPAVPFKVENRTSMCVSHLHRDGEKMMNDQGEEIETVPFSCECKRIEHEYRRIFNKLDEELDPKKDKLHISQMVDTCRRKETITIFKLDDPAAPENRMCMDYHIMKAICCGTMHERTALSPVERLQLAIDWDRFSLGRVVKEMASNELLDDGSLGMGEGSHENRKVMVYALTYALQHNSPRFAELLDNAGVRIPANEDVIKSLYPRSQQPPSRETVTMNSMFWILTERGIKQKTRRLAWNELKTRQYLHENRNVHKAKDDENVKQDIDKAKETRMRKIEMLFEPANKQKKGVRGLFNLDDELHAHVTDSDVKFKKYKFKNELLGTFTHVGVVMELLAGWKCLRSSNVLHEARECLQEIESTKVLGVQLGSLGNSGKKMYNPYHKLLDEKLKNAILDNKDASVYQELFLWAILMGRDELAILYWRICSPASQPHCITRALFACALARKVAQHPLVDAQARKQLMGDSSDVSTLEVNFSSKFEDLALQVIARGPHAASASLLLLICCLSVESKHDCTQATCGECDDFISKCRCSTGPLSETRRLLSTP